MSLQSVRDFFAEKAPDISVIESPISSATVTLAAEAYGVEPGRISGFLRGQNCYAELLEQMSVGRPEMVRWIGRRDVDE